MNNLQEVRETLSQHQIDCLRMYKLFGYDAIKSSPEKLFLFKGKLHITIENEANFNFPERRNQYSIVELLQEGEPWKKEPQFPNNVVSVGKSFLDQHITLSQ